MLAKLAHLSGELFGLVLGLTHFIFRDESFTFIASGLTPKLFVWVYDHKTIGKDRLIGDGEVDVSSLTPISWLKFDSCVQIWRHIQPKGTTASEVSLELRDGNGLVKLRLEFTQELRQSPEGRSSVSSSTREGLSRTQSVSQSSLKASRFSFSRRRSPLPADTSADE